MFYKICLQIAAVSGYNEWEKGQTGRKSDEYSRSGSGAARLFRPWEDKEPCIPRRGLGAIGAPNSRAGTSAIARFAAGSGKIQYGSLHDRDRPHMQRAALYRCAHPPMGGQKVGPDASEPVSVQKLLPGRALRGGFGDGALELPVFIEHGAAHRRVGRREYGRSQAFRLCAPYGQRARRAARGLLSAGICSGGTGRPGGQHSTLGATV